MSQNSPTEEETHQLLYGDLDDPPTDGVSQEDSISQTAPEAEMDVDAALLDDYPGEPSVVVSLDGFGENFALTLHRFLAALKPHTKSIMPNQRELVYSSSARIRVTEEIRKDSAPIYEELLDALLLDRRIKFRRSEPNPSSFTNTMGLFCPCEMVHAAISMCPHYADRHVDLCQQVCVREERQQQIKSQATASVTTEFVIPKIPADTKKEETKPTPSTSTSIVEVSTPSRGGYNSHRGGRGFARGGNRGRSSSTSESDRGRGGNSRNNSRRRDRKNRDRSRSEFSRENRDYNSNKSVGFESPRSQDDRGRSNFKKPRQPAQDRLKEERRKMEEPDNRQKAEERAENSRKIAKNLARQLGRTAASSPNPSTSAGGSLGPSALGSDGQIDYTTVPKVSAPEGMKAVISLKGNNWDIQFVSKD
jgi:hypothetical protein